MRGWYFPCGVVLIKLYMLWGCELILSSCLPSSVYDTSEVLRSHDSRGVIYVESPLLVQAYTSQANVITDVSDLSNKQVFSSERVNQAGKSLESSSKLDEVTECRPLHVQIT